MTDVQRWRRRWTLVGLVALLAGWVGLQMLYSDQATARYARQALAVHTIAVHDMGGALIAEWPTAAADSRSAAEPWLEAVAARLDMVASCLMTDDGSRAPAVVEVRLGGPAPAMAPPLTTVRPLEGAPFDEAMRACVEGALEPVEWPDADVSTVELKLADLRLTTRRDQALARARVLLERR